MISWQSIMSVFNTKGTLLKWLKKLDQSLQDGVLQSVSVNTVSTGVITLTFNFADGSTVTTPQIELPEGPRGMQGVPGTDGTDGADGTNGRDALVQNRALSSANISSPMAVPIEALNRTAVVGEPIVMFATDTTENKTYMLIGTVTNVGSPGVNPYVFVTYSNKVDITGLRGPQGAPGEAPDIPTPTTEDNGKVLGVANGAYALQAQSSGGITLSQVIAREETLPTATADSPDFVQTPDGTLYRKKAVGGGSLLGTWVFNDTVSSGTYDFSLSFTSNNAVYSGMEVTSMYIDYMGRDTQIGDRVYMLGVWQGDYYKTIQITDISSLTNEAEFTSWLTANATKRGGGGGTVTYSYVALADAT